MILSFPRWDMLISTPTFCWILAVCIKQRSPKPVFSHVFVALKTWISRHPKVVTSRRLGFFSPAEDGEITFLGRKNSGKNNSTTGPVAKKNSGKKSLVIPIYNHGFFIGVKPGVSYNYLIKLPSWKRITYPLFKVHFESMIFPNFPKVGYVIVP